MALWVKSFTWASIEKTLEIFLYLAMRPSITKVLHLTLSSGPLALYQEHQIIALSQIWPHPRGHKFYMGLYRENFRNPVVHSHKALGHQILHVT